MRAESAHAELVVLPLPSTALLTEPRSAAALRALSEGLPPMLFAFEGAGTPVTTTDI